MVLSFCHVEFDEVPDDCGWRASSHFLVVGVPSLGNNISPIISPRNMVRGEVQIMPRSNNIACAA